MAGPKPLLTALGIHHRLESCEGYALPKRPLRTGLRSGTDLQGRKKMPGIPAKLIAFGLLTACHLLPYVMPLRARVFLEA